MKNILNTQNYGLILEGGGLRGSYTGGVLDAFMDAGIYFPYVIGVSSGAYTGSSYVAKQKGREIQIVRQFHGDPRYLSIRNLLTTGSIFGKDFLFNQIPNKHIPFDWKTFIESPVRFVMVCINCTTGEPEYFEKKPEMNPADFFTELEASSSMPYSSTIVKYKGKKYLDGAICDAIPLKKAQSEGYKKNVIVLTNPLGFRKKRDPHPPNWLFYIGRKKLIEALEIRVARYNESLDYAEAEEKAGRVIIIRPSQDLKIARAEKNKEKLFKLYELGLRDTQEMLKNNNFQN